MTVDITQSDSDDALRASALAARVSKSTSPTKRRARVSLLNSSNHVDLSDNDTPEQPRPPNLSSRARKRIEENTRAGSWLNPTVMTPTSRTPRPDPDAIVRSRPAAAARPRATLQPQTSSQRAESSQCAKSAHPLVHAHTQSRRARPRTSITDDQDEGNGSWLSPLIIAPDALDSSPDPTPLEAASGSTFADQNQVEGSWINTLSLAPSSSSSRPDAAPPALVASGSSLANQNRETGSWANPLTIAPSASKSSPDPAPIGVAGGSWLNPVEIKPRSTATSRKRSPSPTYPNPEDLSNLHPLLRRRRKGKARRIESPSPSPEYMAEAIDMTHEMLAIPSLPLAYNAAPPSDSRSSVGH